MIGKVKDAVEAKKAVDEIFSRLAENSQAMEAQNNILRQLGATVDGLADTLATLRTYQEELADKFKDNAEASQKLGHELSQSVVNLQVLRSQLQSQIVDKIGEEMQQLKGQFSGEVNEIRKLKEEMILIAGDVAQAREQIDKFTTISSRIKETDFNLSNYAQKLKDTESEKIDLVRQVDSLQRLVAKMRRT